MIKSKVAVAIALALTVTLTGCDDSEAREAENRRIVELEIENQALKDSMAQVNAEKQELAEFIKEMEKEDPLFQDAYYQADDKGDRTLVIVRADESNPQQVVHHSYAGVPQSSGSGNMVSGMLMGWMMGSMMNSGPAYAGGGNHITNIYEGSERRTYSATESKKRKSVAYSGYVAQRTTAAKSSIRANPTKMTAINTKAKAISRTSGTTSRASSFSSKGS